MKWYNATHKDNLQGLIYDEITGENIAVTYRPENAPLVATAPELLEALEAITDQLDIYWKDDNTSFPTDETKQLIQQAREVIYKAKEKG